MFHYNNDNYDIRAKGVRCINVDDDKIDSNYLFGRLYYTVKEIKYAFFHGASKREAYPEYGNKDDKFMTDGPLDCLNWSKWNEADKDYLQLAEDECNRMKLHNIAFANKFC